MRLFINLFVIVMLTITFVGRVNTRSANKPSLLERISSGTVVYNKEFYSDIAQVMGAKYDFNWKWLYGIWMREALILSNDPDVRGDRKVLENGKVVWLAHGVGQVHLKSARAHYDKNITSEQLMNPITNANASAKIFSDYLKLFNYDYEYAVAAYNAGPARIRPYATKNMRPFNYTDYVKDVIEYSQIGNG